MQVKNQILDLRKQGLSYNKIQEILGCSKSAISYHCGKGQKKKKNDRQTKRRSNNCLIQKVENFRNRKYKHITYGLENRDWRDILQIKIRGFSMNRKTKKVKQKFSLQDLINKIGENPTCYLTGRSIDLSDGRSYHLDHIIPISKGGDNSLGNCNIACKEANQAKNNLSKDEFIQLCKEVLNNAALGS
jgi:5-methylcytosine-specific restriction endonuclease McrA